MKFLMEFLETNSVLITVIITVIVFIWGIVMGIIKIILKRKYNENLKSEQKKRDADIIKANEKNFEQQIRANIKPELMLNIPPFEEPSNSEEKFRLQRFGKGDHIYTLKNHSQNIAYDVEFFTVIYLSNQDWKKYYEIIKKIKDDDYDKRKKEQDMFNYFGLKEKDYTDIEPGVIVSSSFVYHDIKNLDKNDYMKNHIPANFFRLNLLDYQLKPKLYIFIKYKDKMGFSYEDCYQLICVNHFSRISGGYFNKRNKDKDKDKVKDKIYEQKRYLKEDFLNPTEVFYFNI